MCSLVMSLCSRDLYVTSLNNNYYNTLNNSRLTVVQLTQCLVFGWYNINLFELDVATRGKVTRICGLNRPGFNHVLHYPIQLTSWNLPKLSHYGIYSTVFALILSCKVYISSCVVIIVGPSRSSKNS